MVGGRLCPEIPAVPASVQACFFDRGQTLSEWLMMGRWGRRLRIQFSRGIRRASVTLASTGFLITRSYDNLLSETT